MSDGRMDAEYQIWIMHSTAWSSSSTTKRYQEENYVPGHDIKVLVVAA